MNASNGAVVIGRQSAGETIFGAALRPLDDVRASGGDCPSHKMPSDNAIRRSSARPTDIPRLSASNADMFRDRSWFRCAEYRCMMMMLLLNDDPSPEPGGGSTNEIDRVCRCDAPAPIHHSRSSFEFLEKRAFAAASEFQSGCLRHHNVPGRGPASLTSALSCQAEFDTMAHVRPSTFLRAVPGPADHLPWYPDTLLPQLQHALRMLADLDGRQDLACPDREAGMVGEDRAAGRGPLVRTLGTLEEQFMNRAGCG
jgi:hypothetical protein